MRVLDGFKMERPGLVKPGDVVEIREGDLPNSVFYYVIEPAVAMSGNISLGDRLVDKNGNVAKTGKVIAVDEKKTGMYVTVEFDI